MLPCLQISQNPTWDGCVPIRKKVTSHFTPDSSSPTVRLSEKLTNTDQEEWDPNLNFVCRMMLNRRNSQDPSEWVIFVIEKLKKGKYCCFCRLRSTWTYQRTQLSPLLSPRLKKLQLAVFGWGWPNQICAKKKIHFSCNQNDMMESETFPMLCERILLQVPIIYWNPRGNLSSKQAPFKSIPTPKPPSYNFSSLVVLAFIPICFVALIFLSSQNTSLDQNSWELRQTVWSLTMNIKFSQSGHNNPKLSRDLVKK